MAREKLSGIYIPVVTPFHRDESINFSAIKEITRFLADNGVTGIIPSGSTGEMIALTKEEQIAVNKAYIEAGHDNGIKVVASTAPIAPATWWSYPKRPSLTERTALWRSRPGTWDPTRRSFWSTTKRSTMRSASP